MPQCSRRHNNRSNNRVFKIAVTYARHERNTPLIQSTGRRSRRRLPQRGRAFVQDDSVTVGAQTQRHREERSHLIEERRGSPPASIHFIFANQGGGPQACYIFSTW